MGMTGGFRKLWTAPSKLCLYFLSSLFCASLCIRSSGCLSFRAPTQGNSSLRPDLTDLSLVDVVQQSETLTTNIETPIADPSSEHLTLRIAILRS